MSLTQYGLAALFGLCLAAGQVLFKIAADQKTPDGAPYSITQILFSAPMIAACILYALTVALYVYLLQQIPLSRAYLFSLLGSALVPIVAFLLFKESFSVKYLIGFALVMSGVAISTNA
ncbi:MAG: SMR family transporter [Pseudomonadota bacterium]